MKLGMQAIFHFLYETYNIDFRKTARKVIHASEDKDKPRINHHLLLNNLFLIRRNRDPGFFQMVTRVVEHDESVKAKTGHYIEHLIAKHESDDFVNLFNFRFKGDLTEPFRIDPALRHGLHRDLSALYNRDLRAKEIGVSLEYFNLRHGQALKSGDYDETAAIVSLIKDYSLGKDFNSELFQEDSLYQGLFTKYDWELEKNRFLFRYINSSDNYFHPTFNLEMLMRGLIAYDPEYIDYALSIIDPELVGLHLGVDGKYGEYVKYLADTLSIASDIWFNGLEEREKIRLLNQEHVFKITHESLDIIFKMSGENPLALIIIAQILDEYHFYDVVIDIFTYILQKVDSGQFEHICYDGIATMHRKLMNYQKALEYYQKDLDEITNPSEMIWGAVTDSGVKDVPLYAKAITMKNIGEMYIRLGNDAEAEKWLNQTLRIAEKSDDIGRCSIYWNLANAYRRAGNYKREHYYLTQFFDLNEKCNVPYSGEVLQEAQERLNILNGPRYILPMFEYDSEKLRKIDADIEKDTFAKRGEYLYYSFQYHDANEWLLKAHRVDNDYFVLFRVGRTHFELGEYFEAVEVFGEVIDKSNDDLIIARSYNYLGLIDLVHGNVDGGIEKISKCISILYEMSQVQGDFSEDDHIITQNIDWTLGACLFCAHHQIRDEIIVFQLFDAILDVIKKYESVCSPHCMVADVFSHFSYTVAAHRYLNIGLKEDVPPPIKALLYETKAKVFRKEGNHSKAIELFKKSIEAFPDEPQRVFWEIALTYELLLDFKEAERYTETALEHEPDNVEYLEAKGKYHALAEQVINFNRIPDGGAKTILHSAESLAIRLFNQIDGQHPFDFSIALVEYGKGLERLLHEAIGSEIRALIHNKFGTPIPDKYWKGEWIVKDGRRFYKIKPLPTSLINLLGIEEKTVSLGQWSGLRDDLKKRLNNPVTKWVFGYFTDRFGGNIDFIENACDIVSELRNGSAHFDVRTKEEVLHLRKEINYCMNDVINHLYPEN